MKTRNYISRKTALAAAVVLLVGGVSTMDGSIFGAADYAWMSSAYAATDGSGNGSGGKQGAMGEGRGGEAGKGASGQGHRGGKSVQDVLAEDDDGDDSDRPDWAGVPGGGSDPARGGGQPDGAGTTKGDIYGDMILLLRNPVTGVPETDADGNLLVCTSADCSTYEPMVDGEVPAGVTTFEVDLGRGSIVRSPTSVIDSRLEEALSLLTADGAEITQDEAGRLVVTVDGVEKTIDSPLENLALYIDLMKGLASELTTSDTEAALGSLATLNTAASLLGGMADKTGDISLDYLMYENLIAGIVASADAFYDYGTFNYTRDYDTTYDFWYSPDGVVVPVKETLDINDYLQFVNGTLPAANEKAALFAAAADDAVEVIDLLHTQVVTDDFLNGFEF